MTTSAQALNQILASVRKHPNQNDKFIAVAMKHLGLEGPDAEPRTLMCIYILVKRVKSDIESLPVDDETKEQARRYIVPFNGLDGFSSIHMDIRNAKNSFLKAEHLVNLTNLHMALSSHTELSDISVDEKKLATDCRALKKELLLTDIPDNSKKILIKRLDQIATILEHFYAFGPEALQDEMEALIGSILINRPPKNESAYAIFLKMGAIASMILVALEATNDILDAALSTTNKSQELIEFIFPNGDELT